MSFALLCGGLLMMAAPGDAASVVPVDPNRAYQEERAKLGRSADDQVRLALWCEARGMVQERLNHLTLAILADPSDARARALLGMVAHDGRFQRPEAIAAKTEVAPILAEYDAKRLKSPLTADGHWSLGLWADEHGLADQARAHFTAVTRLEPRRVEAWKRLGYRQHEGRWLTEPQITAEKAEAEAQKQADRKWKPLLEDLRRRLAYPSKRAEVETELTKLDDPRSVPSIIKVFGQTSGEQSRAVLVLGQIDSPASSRALAVLAIAARSADVRRAATETLRSRDPVEYAELLIGLLGESVRFEVKPVGGIDSPGVLLVEGKQANIRRVYTPPTPFRDGDRVGVNESGESVVFRHVETPQSIDVGLGDLLGIPLFASRQSPGSHVLMNPVEIREAIHLIHNEIPFHQGWTPFRFHFSDIAEIPLGRMIAEGQKSAVASARQLRSDVEALEAHNRGVRMANERVARVLNDATGQSLDAARLPWMQWYLALAGYASPTAAWTSRIALTQAVAIGYQPPVLPDGSHRRIDGYELVKYDCFAAGTPVRTIAGPRAIESLRVGDRVLTQNSRTGALGYHPVVATHQTPALPTLRIKLKDDSITSSHFHRFWISGRGWILARDLKSGDSIRTLGGVVAIESVEPDTTQSVYNLDVAEDADFFVGARAALVHDHTQPDPRLVPFDATH